MNNFTPNTIAEKIVLIVKTFFSLFDFFSQRRRRRQKPNMKENEKTS